ncbi:post-transcriptional regulator [Cohnella fermenti]|nr:post-transcriptional regulator [Cohnella fermenti]
MPDNEDEAARSEVLSEAERNRMIEQLCVNKAEEFRMIGYEQVTGPDIWECVSDRYYKSGTPALHVMVNDIMSLKVNQYMNYITLSLYRGEKR